MKTTPKKKNLIVQKRDPLLSLVNSGMSLMECKILDLYLGKINSRKENERRVVIEKGEFEELLGVSRIRRERLEGYLDNLCQYVTLNDDTKPNGFWKIPLFDSAHCYQEKGLWHIELICSLPAMQYIFNVEKIGYFRYRFQDIRLLSSRYSYFFYLYAKRKLHMAHVNSLVCRIEVNELKQLLNCDTVNYSQFKYFNAQILKKCCEELNKLTSLQIDYYPIKKGKAYQDIEFHIRTNEKILTAESKQIQENETPQEEEIIEATACVTSQTRTGMEKDEIIRYYGNEELAALAEVCELEFDKKQIKMIYNIISRINIEIDSSENLMQERQRYLQKRYKKMCEKYDEKINTAEPIKNRFFYLKRILENEAPIQLPSKK